jgi:glycerol-3-phosphate O-acyltransferase
LICSFTEGWAKPIAGALSNSTTTTAAAIATSTATAIAIAAVTESLKCMQCYFENWQFAPHTLSQPRTCNQLIHY